MKVRENAKLLEEDVAHAVIVVLVGVDHAPIEDVFVLAEFADDRCDLHEIGAGGHGVGQFCNLASHAALDAIFSSITVGTPQAAVRLR